MSSKFLNTATAIALIAAPAAWAGSLSVAPSEPEMAPMVAPVAAPYDWSGFYAGLSAGKTTGDFDITVTYLLGGGAPLSGLHSVAMTWTAGRLAGSLAITGNAEA